MKTRAPGNAGRRVFGCDPSRQLKENIMKKNMAGVLTAAALAAAVSTAFAATATVTINAISDKGAGESLGTVQLEDSKDGLVLNVALKGLAPGEHGFHVHEHGNCAHQEKDGKNVAGLAAGGHYDPQKTGKHEGPTGQGHLGDLPLLVVAPDGTAKVRLMAPRLKVSDVKGRALMIHEGGDNYSDNPKPLGGGGARVACGVVK
jgi:Cu-Zn family superoxide dismutase